MGDAAVVLVTGASGGIGRAVALAYAERGANLVLTARSGGRLADLVAACERRGAEAVGVVADVSDAPAMRAVITRAGSEFGRLDVVVHTAALVAYGRLTEVPDEIWDRTMDVNVRGTVNVARETLRVFEAAGSGHLVVIGSVLGQVTVPYMGSYVASKFAVHALVRVLQQEARKMPGVHVALVSPGGIDTAIYRNAATYVGHAGKPPPPVLSPEAVARAVLRTVDRGRARAGVGPGNPLMRLGFTVAPRIYDLLVEPLFNRLALARQGKDPNEGNVFRTTEETETEGQTCVH